LTTTSPTISRLTDSQVGEGVQQGLSNDFKQTSSRSYGDIVRVNVFHLVNIVLYVIGFGMLLVGDVRSAIVVVYVVPGFRAFFQLVPIRPFLLLLILGMTLLWVLVTRGIWRTNWLEHFLDVEVEEFQKSQNLSPYLSIAAFEIMN